MGSSLGGVADIDFIFSAILSLTGWVGLFGFVYSKRFFIKKFWIIFFILEIIGFFLGIASAMIQLLYESFLLGFDQIFFAILIFSFVFATSVPILLAHYKYIFTSQWNISYA